MEEMMMKGSTTAPLLIAVVVVGIGVGAFMITAPAQTVNQVQAGIGEIRTTTKANSLDTYIRENFIRNAIDFNLQSATYHLANDGGGFNKWGPGSVPSEDQIEQRLESNATGRFEDKYLWSQGLGENDQLSVPSLPYQVHERYDVFDGNVLKLLTRDVELVFVMDTSGSMSDDWDDVCAIRNEVGDRLNDQGIDNTITVYGLDGTEDCADESLSESPVDHLEDWGPGTQWAAESHDWGDASVKIVFPMSDECPQDGDGCNSADQQSIDDAIAAAQDEGVYVYPIWGSGMGQQGQDYMTQLATATGGSANPKGAQDELADTVVGAARVIEKEYVNDAGALNYSGWTEDRIRFRFRDGSARTDTYLTDHLNNISRGNRYFYQYNLTSNFFEWQKLRKTISRTAANVSNTVIGDRGGWAGDCNPGPDPPEDYTCPYLEDPQDSPEGWQPVWSGSVHAIKEDILNKQEEIVTEQRLRSAVENNLTTYLEDFEDSQDNWDQYEGISVKVGKVGIEYEIDDSDVERIEDFEDNELDRQEGWYVSNCAEHPEECGCAGDCPVQVCSTDGGFTSGFQTGDHTRGTQPMWGEDPWHFHAPEPDRPVEYEDPYEFVTATSNPFDHGPTAVSVLEDVQERMLGAPRQSVVPVAETNGDNECEPDSRDNKVFQMWRNGWEFSEITATVHVELYATDTVYFIQTKNGLKHQNFTVEYVQEQTAIFHDDGSLDEINYNRGRFIWEDN